MIRIVLRENKGPFGWPDVNEIVSLKSQYQAFTQEAMNGKAYWLSSFILIFLAADMRNLCDDDAKWVRVRMRVCDT